MLSFLSEVAGHLIRALRHNVPTAPLVLTVRLLFRGCDAAVRLELSGGALPSPPEDAGDADENPFAWEFPYADFQREAVEAAASKLHVPKSAADDLQYRIALAATPAPRPLWLNLARPYGLLGGLAWERELAPALGRDILRLPDSPHPPGERADILENALIVDPNADASPEDIVRRAKTVIDAILAGSSRPGTRIHVFANGWCEPHLRTLHDKKRVFVYDPASYKPAEPAVSETSAGAAIANSPTIRFAAWTMWIGELVRDRGVDAVHLICRARPVDDGTALFLSSSPKAGASSEDVVALLPLDQAELALLMTRAGAWAVTFGATEGDSDVHLACFADGFARCRPGAVLFASLGASPDPGVPAAFKLLFGKRPGLPPKLRDGFLYCHPSFVIGSEADSVGAQLDLLATHTLLRAQRTPFGRDLVRTISKSVTAAQAARAAAAPGWLTTTQRLLETAAFDELRKASDDVLLSAPATTGAVEMPSIEPQMRQSTELLSEIQDVIGNYLASNRMEL